VIKVIFRKQSNFNHIALITGVSLSGYKSEIDLFIAQVILQQLCLKEDAAASETFDTYTKYHPKIECGPPFIKPLLNFIYFLLKTIESGSGKLTTFKALCELYKTSLERDPSYNRYLVKIGCIFFNGEFLFRILILDFVKFLFFFCAISSPTPATTSIERYNW
jgi:hypothetical protein